MHVGLDQAGQDEAAGAVAHLRRALRPRSVLPSFRRLTNRRNSSLAHDDIRPLHPPGPPSVVQQHVAAGKDEVGRAARHGTQVVIRGWAAVESSGRSK